ncbi:putative 3-dehydroshikimate dehydratase [Amylocarpus encephaloides]|uniref:3-dehydroshikimate dehydratase n=1 Tax=Amylocarpus encephaloides TaxID=45428 RepID=A0A9P7YRH5_9HELO|nr:putative 3-dehydroshikimate dehydratase [Amylocarpus encephaloides]
MSYKPALASLSLGRAWLHDLPPKFTAAANAGLQGIEIFYEDLLYFATTLPGGSSLPVNQILTAHHIRTLADNLSLSIMALGPFSDCEGLRSATAKAEKQKELRLWFEVARILGTDIIQIPSTFKTQGFTGDMNVIVSDLREISDIGGRENPPFRFAYENLCFGTYNDTWEKAWEVVKGVGRSNFGLCLDTFNIAGRGWADPTREDGKVENADAVFKESLKNLVKEVDVNKVFYVQVVDAEKMRRPLVKGHAFHKDGQKPRMSWSRNARLFMCEEDRGGYLPVVDVLKAICDEKEGLGYKGWISMEFFNRSLVGETSDVPAEHARRAVESWKKLVKVMGWESKVEETAPRKHANRRSNVVGQPETAEISARL